MPKNIAASAAALIIILAGIVFASVSCVRKAGRSETSFTAMDTACNITLYSKKHEKEYINEIARLDKELDRYNKESTVYIFNDTGSAELSEDAALLFEQSKELYNEYGNVDVTCGGLISLWGITGDSPEVPSASEIKSELLKTGFDKIERQGSRFKTTVSTQLDFGATAKGYALDRIKRKLLANSEKCAVVSLGSSTLLFGKKPDKSSFTVAVKDPKAPDRILLEFETDEGFVSTSGGYERYFDSGAQRYIHILDLKTGAPVLTDLESVTVIADSGIKSDFLSTAILIDGTPGLEKHLSTDDYQVIAVTSSGEIRYSPSLEGKIKLK